MNIWDREKYNKAWYFATRKHTGQTYGGAEQNEKIDYINHIGSVTMEIIWVLQNTSENFNADLAVQCAILHDTIEDTDTNYKEIYELFGKDVADGVKALTKNEKLSKDERMSDSLKRIQQQAKEIWLVKIADRISNLYHPPYYWDNEKKINYIKESEIIYGKLNSAGSLISKRLRNKIDNYHKYIKRKK